MNCLYKTKEEAIKSYGSIFEHYKGGIYRVINDNVKHTENSERGVYYEHIWPNAHGFYYRPYDVFFSDVEKGKKRFKPL